MRFINVYTVAGTGLGVSNRWLLEIAAAGAMWEDRPWIAVEDWNMEATEVEASGWRATVDGKAMAPRAAREDRARSSTTSRKAWHLWHLMSVGSPRFSNGTQAQTGRGGRWSLGRRHATWKKAGAHGWRMQKQNGAWTKPGGLCWALKLPRHASLGVHSRKEWCKKSSNEAYEWRSFQKGRIF